MKKFTFLLFSLFITHITFSQCINSTANPLTATASDNSGEVQTITTNSETDEYVTISNIIPGDNYIFTNAHTDATNEYITITNESNGVIIHGMSPLTTNIIAVSTIRMHISVDSICTTDLFFHTTTVQNLSKVTCNKPINPLISYLSNSRIDFSWSPPILSTPTSYDWEIVPSGNAQGVGVIASGNSVTTNASTGEVLSTGTAYSIYIRSDCDANGFSSYLGPLNITTLSAPPPANDFCNGAISIIQETGIANAAAATATAGTLLGGAGTDVDAESCSGSANARDDVWFSFLAQTTNIKITLEPSGFNGILTLFSGDCNSLVYIDCSDSNGGLAPREEEISYSGFVIGQTYYTRAYSQGFSTASPAFNIKIWSSTATVDNDNDGFSNVVDCNDNNASIYPGATEIIANGIDENCDGLFIWYQDLDLDGYGSSTTVSSGNSSPGSGESNNSLDCNDSSASINPGATDIVANGIDENCDGLFIWYQDLDLDGYGTSTTVSSGNSSPGSGESNNSLDCNDSNASINPGAIEVCDNMDNNCNSSIDEGNVCVVDLGIKVFLQGPYDTNTGLMIDDLRSTANIPTTSPYADAITCNASVFNVTGNNAIIDWVWIEIRDGGDGTTVIASTSGLIQADGDVVDVDGLTEIAIDVPFGNYYIMISHRNHLGVLTASTESLSGGTLNLDLTTNSALVVGGTNGIADMGDGNYALYAGDFNGDGQIQNSDKNAVEPLRGTNGYSNADIDMNSEVQNSDINSVLNPNIGKGEQFLSRSLFAKRNGKN